MFDALLDDLIECEQDEIPNHAPEGDEYIAIGECSSPIFAHGNCNAVSSHLFGELHSDHPSLSMIRGVFDNGMVHDALEFEGSVIDYTMRQFHEDVAFPWIAPVDEWEALVGAGGLATHGGELKLVRTGSF